MYGILSFNFQMQEMQINFPRRRGDACPLSKIAPNWSTQSGIRFSRICERGGNNLKLQKMFPKIFDWILNYCFCFTLKYYSCFALSFHRLIFAQRCDDLRIQSFFPKEFFIFPAFLFSFKSTWLYSCMFFVCHFETDLVVVFFLNKN